VNKTILIVEDEREVAKVIEQLLKQWGYATYCVSKGLEAIEYVRQSRPYLVLLDIHLPDINGLEVLNWPFAHFRG